MRVSLRSGVMWNKGPNICVNVGIIFVLFLWATQAMEVPKATQRVHFPGMSQTFCCFCVFFVCLIFYSLEFAIVLSVRYLVQISG